MKKKQFEKKLNLIKTTVAMLLEHEQGKIIAAGSVPPGGSCCGDPGGPLGTETMDPGCKEEDE